MGRNIDCPVHDCNGVLLPVDPPDNEKGLLYKCNEEECCFKTLIKLDTGNGDLVLRKVQNPSGKKKEFLKPWAKLYPEQPPSKKEDKTQDGERLPNYTQPSIVPGRAKNKPFKME
jgi:hypothetical protein